MEQERLLALVRTTVELQRGADYWQQTPTSNSLTDHAMQLRQDLSYCLNLAGRLCKRVTGADPALLAVDILDGPDEYVEHVRKLRTALSAAHAALLEECGEPKSESDPGCEEGACKL